MLRSLISEGRIVYQTVVISDGPPETVTIIKNGPIAAIITTARNVDPELKTRLLPMDTDESGRSDGRHRREHPVAGEADTGASVLARPSVLARA